MLDIATASVKRSLAVKEEFLRTGLEPVIAAAQAMADAFAAGKKMLVFGNGGSAADAQHLAAELVNRFMLERPGLPCVALTTDTSIITAVANDYSFEDLFAKQLRALGAEGDVAMGISTSGNSPNVLKALMAARERGMVTIGMTGKNGGRLINLCDLTLVAPTEETPRIQEIHGLIVHLLCELVDYTLFGRTQ